MEFSIGQDMGSYRQVVWKGLTVKEIGALLFSGGVGGGGMFLLKQYLPTEIAINAAVFLVAPLVSAVFFRYKDMGLFEFLWRKFCMKKTICYGYQSTETPIREKRKKGKHV